MIHLPWDSLLLRIQPSQSMSQCRTPVLPPHLKKWEKGCEFKSKFKKTLYNNYSKWFNDTLYEQNIDISHFQLYLCLLLHETMIHVRGKAVRFKSSTKSPTLVSQITKGIHTHIYYLLITTHCHTVHIVHIMYIQIYSIFYYTVYFFLLLFIVKLNSPSTAVTQKCACLQD